MILHLLSEESGLYEERPKRSKQPNPNIPRIPRVKIETQDFPFNRPESTGMVEVLDVVTSEWNSLSARLKGRN
jgi:hypothetical protein